MSESESQKPFNPYAGSQNASNPVSYQPPFNPNGGDSTGGLIPYKNPKALIAYYLGILSGLPVIGLPLGIAAFVLGIMGLNDRKKNPEIKGSVHAGIGIGCGLIFTLLWGSLIVVGIIVAVANAGARR
jgi:hypothetical protein